VRVSTAVSAADVGVIPSVPVEAGKLSTELAKDQTASPIYYYSSAGKE